MSHPLLHTSAHENDSKLETKHQPQKNENCDQEQRASSLPFPLINTSLQRGVTRPRLFSSCFNSFSRHPTESDQIRPYTSNFLKPLACRGGKEKLNTNPKKPLKFNFI
jgi:hypothetical protein